MLPVPSDVHVNRPLTNMSVAIFQGMGGFVANKVAPFIPSKARSDQYFTFDEAYFNRDTLTVRAPGARSNTIKYKVGTGNYYCEVWSAAHLIPDMVRANEDAPLNSDRQAMELVVRAAKIRLEKLWVTNFFNTGLWTNHDYDGVTTSPTTNQFLRWDISTSDPVADVSAGKMTILSKTGLIPNKMVVGAKVHEALKRHPDILTRIQYGASPMNPALVTPATLAAIFEVEEYLVMSAIEDTSVEEATSSPAFIGGNDAGLFYVASAPGIMVPTAMATFSWTEYLGATAEGYRINKFRMDPEKSDAVEIEIAVDMKLISAKLGAFWEDAVS